MDPQPDVIRQQIEDTRSSLTEKLETLEAEVKGTVETAKETVESAKETVEETISSVKESVISATETVKRTFDLEYQTDRHPWGMLGLSLLSGAALGALFGSRLSPERQIVRGMSAASTEPPERPAAAPASAWARLTHAGDSRPGFMDKLTSQLGDEFDKVKDLAISTLVGVVGDVARKSIPTLANTVEEMMSRAAAQAGATPQQYGSQCAEPEPRSGYAVPPAY